jgi:tRNA-(ms[2]io[6]A)-hydroxylase
MVDLACEELEHFRRVYGWLVARGSTLGADAKDEYVVRMMGLVRRGPELYLLDRLLVAGIVEARGCERFRLLGEELAGDLAAEYRELARCEARHAALFAGLAKRYFASNEVERRAQELFRAEAEILASLPLRAALH